MNKPAQAHGEYAQNKHFCDGATAEGEVGASGKDVKAPWCHHVSEADKSVTEVEI